MKAKWTRTMNSFFKDETETMLAHADHLRLMWSQIQAPEELSVKQKKTTKLKPAHSARSTREQRFDTTGMEEIKAVDFDPCMVQNTAELFRLDDNYPLLQPMTVTVEDFDITTYAHHNVVPNGSCLVNACAYAILKNERNARKLRTDIVKFVDKLGPKLFRMRSRHTELTNLDIEILETMSNQETIQSRIFTPSRSDHLTDEDLNTRLMLFYIFSNSNSHSEILNCVSEEHAQYIRGIYMRHSLNLHKTSAGEGSDSHILLYFLCLMYDIGFILWTNTSATASDLSIVHTQVIHRNLKHGMTSGTYPFVHILHTHAQCYLQNVYYGSEHFSLLLPHGQMYTIYDHDKIQLMQENVPVPMYHFNPSTTLDDISFDLFGQNVTLDMIRLTFTARYPVREFNDFVHKVRRVLNYLEICDMVSTAPPHPEFIDTVRKYQTVYQLLVFATDRAQKT